MSSYSFGQQALLALMPRFTGTIGLTSSVLLMSEIIRDYVIDNDTNPIKRALFAVTCFEICDSFGWWLSTWAIPSHIDFLWASGTWTSCNFQGFLLEVAIGAPFCNGFLTFIFFTIVKGYDWKDDVNDDIVENDIGHVTTTNNVGTAGAVTATNTAIVTTTPPVRQRQRWTKLNRIEWYFYSCVIVYAFGTSFLFLGLSLYNPINQVCVINGYPLGCSESVFGGSDVPCERGFNAHWYGIFGFYLLLWIIFSIVIYLNIVMRRLLIQSNSTDAQWVTTQALLFSVAFILTWMPSTLWFVLPIFGVTGFWLDILSATFEPLLGFWNLLIFVRNRPDSVERIKQICTCQRFWCCSHNDDDDANNSLDDSSCRDDENDHTVKRQELQEDTTELYMDSTDGSGRKQNSTSANMSPSVRK
jgi:hypothetical protein